MKKVILAVVFAAASVAIFVAANAASAVSTLTMNSYGDLSNDGTTIALTGTILCPAGDTADIEAIITQSSGNADGIATGSASVTCTGQLQNWVATATLAGGAGFKKGLASVSFAASDSGGSTAIQTQKLHLK